MLGPATGAVDGGQGHSGLQVQRAQVASGWDDELGRTGEDSPTRGCKPPASARAACSGSTCAMGTSMPPGLFPACVTRTSQSAGSMQGH